MIYILIGCFIVILIGLAFILFCVRTAYNEIPLPLKYDYPPSNYHPPDNWNCRCEIIQSDFELYQEAAKRFNELPQPIVQIPLTEFPPLNNN